MAHIKSIAIFLSIFCIGISSANKMDPHVYPKNGPFFEGWYTRITDRSQDASFAFLFGLVLPKNSENNDSLLCVSILASPPGASSLQSPSGCFDPSEYTVLQNGEPVSKNPDDRSPPNFEVKISDKLKFVVTEEGSEFYVNVGDHTLQGKTASPVPWGPNGEGPESWMKDFPFPIHWFVYSLRSTITEYSYTNAATGLVVKGGSTEGQAPDVVAHMEKNWGNSFNEAWVWSEGVDPSTNVSYAIAAGKVKMLGITIPAQLSGYRNPNKGISCSFNPTKSVHTLTHDACAGTATFDVRSLGCHVVFELSAPVSSFGKCLVTPQVVGFRKGAVESFVATANITATSVRWGKTIKDNQVISLSALEFGGQYMCNGACP